MKEYEKPYIPSTEERESQNALIGEFIIRFEAICGFIRYNILNLCYPQPKEIERYIIDSLLEGLGADNLRKKLEALIYGIHKDRESLITVNKKVSTKFTELISVRNKIAHGFILPHWATHEGKLSPDHMLIQKSTHTAKGTTKNSMIVKADNIKHLINQAGKLYHAYSVLGMLCGKINMAPMTFEKFINDINSTLKDCGKIKIQYEHNLNYY